MVDSLKRDPVAKAVQKGNMEILKTLLQKGANPNIVTDGCLSPLNRAIKEDKIEIS